MKTQHISIDFSDVRDAELPEFTDKIITGFTDNPALFPAPPVPVATIQTQRNDYQTKLDNAINGTPADTAAKDAARLTLETTLKSDGRYADTVTGTNVADKLLSGYPLTDLPEPIGEFHAPDFLRVINGDNPGEFDVDIAVVDKASGYLVAFAFDGDAEPNPYNWMLRWTQKHRNTFTGFESGKKYKVAAAAVGASNNVNFGNAVTRIAQ
jgi:hypothetical protein